MAKHKHKSSSPKPLSARAKADTHDILNPRAQSVKINPKWERHHRHLLELRAYFLRQKGMLIQDANEEQPSYSEHMADAGTDSYDRDFALSMLSSDQNALYEIEAALERIAGGTYGICEITGKPIATQRLNAIPWARFSMETEQQLEQRGTVNRIRLGRLGSLSESGGEEEEAGEADTGENAP